MEIRDPDHTGDVCGDMRESICLRTYAQHHEYAIMTGDLSRIVVNRFGEQPRLQPS
jgi:hypothetical protein